MPSCRVFIDNEWKLVKNFYINKDGYGFVPLESIKVMSDTGWVIIQSEGWTTLLSSELVGI
jgi:hypothetical protein